ncbi:MAG: hypothetical protein ACXADY_01350 [Candidatus Hodarchaeales archaeon]|jgi:uncharacterized membrane protein YidH (DUF202 family)
MPRITRILVKFRTEIIGAIIALVLISAGLIIPSFIPDQSSLAPPGFEDTTWIKTFISVLLIGMGILCFAWLVLIQKYISRKSKKDYMY